MRFNWRLISSISLLCFAAVAGPYNVEAQPVNLRIQSADSSGIMLRIKISRRIAASTMNRGSLRLNRACDSGAYSTIGVFRKLRRQFSFFDFPDGFSECAYQARLSSRVKRRSVVFISHAVSIQVPQDSPPPLLIEDTPTPAPTPRIAPVPRNPELPVGFSECNSTNETKMLARINYHRALNHYSTLSSDSLLHTAARIQTIKMGQLHSLTHDGWAQTLMNLGYTGTFLAQNIAYEIPDPVQIVDLWMVSPGHKENILTDRSTHAGVSCVLDSRGAPWWAVDFGN